MIIIINVYSEVLEYNVNGEKYYSYDPINKICNDLFIMCFMSDYADQFIYLFILFSQDYGIFIMSTNMKTEVERVEMRVTRKIFKEKYE